MNADGFIVHEDKPRRKRAPRLALGNNDIRTATLRELMEEIRRRSVGAIMVITVLRGAHDETAYLLKGSRVMLRGLQYRMNELCDPEDGEAWKG
jgi:hypothetical protein